MKHTWQRQRSKRVVVDLGDRAKVSSQLKCLEAETFGVIDIWHDLDSKMHVD